MSKTETDKAKAPPSIVERTRLIERIVPQEGQPPTVTTVVAPAGYGKTTLLRNIEAYTTKQGGPPCVFLSLAECEGHVGLMLDLVVDAVREAFPDADVGALLSFKKSVPASEINLRLPYVLSRMLEKASAGSVLLLMDDLQHLRAGEPLTELVAGLLRGDTPNIRFVLASRSNLPLDLSAFRDAGDIVSLTSQELELSAAEVHELLERSLGRRPDDAIADRVYEQTRGWPGALALVLMAARDMDDAALRSMFAEAPGQSEPIVDFVVRRLLQEHRPPLQYFMKVVSVLGRVEPDVVAALFADDAPRSRGAASDRFFIQLPTRELPRYLVELEEAQVLVRDDGGTLRFNPLVGASLRALLLEDTPTVYREANRRAASFYLAKEGPVSATALDHLVEAGDFERLLAVLEGEAERFFAAGYHRHLSHWLLALEKHYAALPFWASYYLGRVYAMLGDWDRARSYLDRCKGLLKEREKTGDLWRWQPRICLGYAGMYWRRGMHNDASTYCRRGLDFLRQVRRRGGLSEQERLETVTLQLGLLDLLGTLKLEAGSYDKAWEVFREAVALSGEEGLHVEEAAARKNLGLIATRRGDIAEGTRHYQEALELVDRAKDVEIYATVAANLATNQLITGEYDEAARLLERALAIRLETGHPASIAQTLTTLGQLHAAAGQPDKADHAFHRAVRMLESIGNLKTRAEVLERYAAFLAAQGRLYESQTMHDRADGLIGGMLRAEAPLAALHRETAMELSMARGKYEEALGHLMSAVERYEKLGARYNVARLYWKAAGIHHRLFLEERRTTPESVVSYLELACAEANRNGYLFGPLEPQREMILVGKALGLPETVKYCDKMLMSLDGRIPDEDEVIELPEPAASRYQRFQQRMDREDEYEIVSREGRAGAAEPQIEELVAARGGKALVVLLGEQEMVNFGDHASLSQKRVILPLLVHFLRNPEEAFTMNELAESVWGSSDLNESMKTKVKVAISRLRSLLGKNRSYIVTGRKSVKDGGSVVTYGLDQDLEFYLVQTGDDQEI